MFFGLLFTSRPKTEILPITQPFLWRGVEFCIISLVESIMGLVICELSLGWQTTAEGNIKQWPLKLYIENGDLKPLTK